MAQDTLAAESAGSGANSSGDESDTIDAMLANHQAESWSETPNADDDLEARADDPTLPPLDRLEAYVDYCFETYPIVYNWLDRDDVQCCVADWDRRRGQHKANAVMRKRRFGKQVRDSKYRRREYGKHVILLAKALIGVPPEEDRGVGWKPCVRHELGHAIDQERRGTSDHSKAFKDIMRQFGEDGNDGMSTHGWAPRRHR